MIISNWKKILCDEQDNSSRMQHFSQRVGKPEDIARACLYLTMEGNDFITGTNLVDGGMTKRMIYVD
ncbi:MAG: SDR family oxidoreductase [Bacillota bacterium]